MLPKVQNVRKIYLDHAATSPVDKKTLLAMKPYFGAKFGNPSALYSAGREARQAVEDARRSVAQIIGALPENIIFTGSGSESDNLAILGVARANESKGKHIVSLAIEHHAVLEPLAELKKLGFEITYIKVDKHGLTDSADVAASLRPDTILVTIMYANNEMGAIQPIADIGREIVKFRKKHNSPYPYFHSDACQAAGYLDMNMEKLHLDLMTLNGSKIYGPKGVGMLYVRRGVNIKPLIFGGGQEKGRRAGTENVPLIVGMAESFRNVQANREAESKRLRELTGYFLNRLADIPEVELNGPAIGGTRLPNNLNVTFSLIEGEAMLLYLDEYGIMCSTGSACTSESLEPSHVLRAMGLPYEAAHGSIRFTLGKSNTKKDVDYVMKFLPAIVAQLREISPLNSPRK